MVAETNAVLREEKDGLVTLTLNRPNQYNTLSKSFLASLQEEFEGIARNKNIRVVILGATGKAFCAGHDLKELQANPEKQFSKDLFEQCSHMMMTIHHMPQPIIAKVQGVATAAGCQLVAACDLAVASEEARFATSGINVGLFCSTPAVAVSRKIGRKQAFELLFTGDFISAGQALEWGLINRMVPHGQLDVATQKLAETLLAKSPSALRSGKKIFYKQLEMNLNDAYAFANDVISCDMMTEDVKEGISAFIEKRKPVWKI